MSVVRGPWGSTPVTQPSRRASLDGWFRRDTADRLWVLPKYSDRWVVAPVVEASLDRPLPDRPATPTRITVALDARGMHGSEVDEALGVLTAKADVVDRWETGDLLPTHSEIRRLATLTGMLPRWFYLPPVPELGTVFICGGR